MNFAPDDFASVHRRKRLAAWLGTLKGPAKAARPAVEGLEAMRASQDYLAPCANLQNQQNPYAQAYGVAPQVWPW